MADAWATILTKSFWEVWEAWNKSNVSVSSCFHCIHSSWDGENACSPRADIMVVPLDGYNSCTATTSSRKNPSLFVSTLRKFFPVDWNGCFA